MLGFSIYTFYTFILTCPYNAPCSYYAPPLVLTMHPCFYLRASLASMHPCFYLRASLASMHSVA